MYVQIYGKKGPMAHMIAITRLVNVFWWYLGRFLGTRIDQVVGQCHKDHFTLNINPT